MKISAGLGGSKMEAKGGIIGGCIELQQLDSEGMIKILTHLNSVENLCVLTVLVCPCRVYHTTCDCHVMRASLLPVMIYRYQE